jgi:hypothetical protein
MQPLGFWVMGYRYYSEFQTEALTTAARPLAGLTRRRLQFG